MELGINKIKKIYLNLKTANDKSILIPICIDCANGIKNETSVKVHK